MTKINFLDCLQLFFNKNTSWWNTTCNSQVLCIQGRFSQQLTYSVHTEQAVLDLLLIHLPDIPEVTLWERGPGFWRWTCSVIKISWKTRTKPINEYTLNSLNKREISHHYDESNYYPVRIQARPQVIFHSMSYTIRSLGATAPLDWSHKCVQCL